MMGFETGNEEMVVFPIALGEVYLECESFLLHLLHKFHPLGTRFAMTPIADCSEFLGMSQTPK